MPNYIPSGGIVDGQIIFDEHVYRIIDGLSGTTGYDINAGSGILYVSASRNVGINTTNPSPVYQLVVNGKQFNNNELRISGSGAELYVNFLATSSTATNFVTYDPTSGKFFTTSSGILDKYLLSTQSGSFLTTASLAPGTTDTIRFTKGDGTSFNVTIDTGSVANFATTASNIFRGNQIISGNLTVTGSTNLPGLTQGVGGGFILTYDNVTGQLFYTQSTSALTPPDLSGYLLIAQTTSMLAPYLLISQTSSFATTGSNIFIGNQTITGSLTVSGGLTTLFNTRATGSFTGSFAGFLTGTSSWAQSASQAVTASYVNLTGNSNIEIDYINHQPSIRINGTVGVQDGGGSTSQATTLNFTDFITASVAGGVANISVSSSILGGVQIQDDGSTEGSVFTINFAENLDVNVAGNTATVEGTMKVAKDGAINPSTTVKVLNFSGSGVSSVSVASNTASIFIPATSGVIIQDNTVNKGSNTTINFVGATVATSSGTATITITGGAGSPSVQNATSTLVPTASSFIFSGSGVVTTQVNTISASIHIPGTAGNNGNIQYNSGSSPAGASTFNFISSSNQVQLTGSLIVSGSGVAFSSSLSTTSSVFFTGLGTTSSISSILTYNQGTGQLYYTSSDEFQQIRVKSGSNITSSRMLEFTGSGVSVTFSANPVTASINIPSYISPGPTGYLSFYSSSGAAPTSQSLYPVSSSNQRGVFWDIINNRLGINKITPEYTLEVSGSFGATTKSFIVPHKTQEGKYLQYGVTEGPEHSVFVRGKSNSHVIELPEEWEWLVDQDTITVNLTSVGEYQNLYILDIIDNKVIVGSNTITPNFHYQVFAERKDVPKLKTII